MPEDPKIWAAFVTGLLGLIGAVYATLLNVLNRREQDRFKAETDKELERFRAQTEKEVTRLNAELQAERDKRMERKEADKIVSKFRDPLLHAAYDLQSRLYNIMRNNFLEKFYTRGSRSEKEYVVENTVFLVAQFLGWTELVRQEIQFLDIGTDQQTRELRRLQDKTYTLFQTDRFGVGFRLFAGEQRAVGELMIDNKTGVPRCLGFASFLVNRDPRIDRWLDPLRQDIEKMSVDKYPYQDRLIKIHHALIDLLKFLDPKYVRFPETSRSKI